MTDPTMPSLQDYARAYELRLLDSGGVAVDEPKWLPIETAPKGGKWILLWWPYVTTVAFSGYCSKGVWHSSFGSSWPGGKDPTHWMPLPSPPKAEP